MNHLKTDMPVLYKHLGKWSGTYRFVDTQYELLDQYDFIIDCEFPDEGTVAYRQTSQYFWPDGRQQQLCFEAEYHDKAIVWNNGRIAGKMWELDEETLYLKFRFLDQADVHVTEMIQISPCGQHRGRTWHWFKQNQLYQLTLVNEQRVH